MRSMKQKKMILTNKNNFTSNSYLSSSSNTTQISNSYSSRQEKKKQNSFQSMYSIQSSTSETESTFDVELLTVLKI